MTEYGIGSAAVSIPRLRLERSAIAKAHNWANPNLQASAKGVKSFCGSDEDAVTLAVNAGNNCLQKTDAIKVDSLTLASTSLPFIDRQHSTLIAEALNLDSRIQTLDVTASMRSATSALIQQLELGSHKNTNHLIIAAESSLPQAGSPGEMTAGDGAAALLLSNQPIAKFIAAESRSVDLVDHYRTPQRPHSYEFEPRWVQQQGYNKIIPEVTKALLEKTGVAAASIKHCILPIANLRTAKSIAKLCGIDESALADNLSAEIGQCGCAHPLLMLAKCLNQVSADEHILVIGFGQGADALLFQGTQNATSQQSKNLDTAAIKLVDSYTRYLSSKNLLKMDWGMRAERDNRTAMSVYYRKRKAINSFIGGQCSSCNTIQFPLSKVCVDPNCGAIDTQDEFCLKNEPAKVKSFTEDWLGHSTTPPLKYGNVLFENGANVMMEFCDFEPGELAVGLSIKPSFRIKDIDELRGFKRYFWKAAPAGEK